MRSLLILLSVILLSFSLPSRHVTVFMIGDSTMSVKEKKAYPETGWGMPFVNFFDTTVTINNHARNGRSTKSFIAEGLWQPVADDLKPGDYLLIQFGHNDEVPTKASYTTEADFKKNLILFVTTAQSKHAKPVLITPVTRRKFDAAGKITETHDVYSGLTRDVARQLQVPLIDLDRQSQQLLQNLGPEPSKLLFNYLEPGEHPNYPDGRQDNTHFSELGARKIAELVLAQIRELKLDLADHIVNPKSNPGK